MSKREFIARLEAGDMVVIARERCFMKSDLKTVPRRLVEAFQNDDKLEFVRRHSNFDKMYKLA